MIEIKITNWNLYNPRNDQKKHSWFRLENTFPFSPDMYGLNADERYLVIVIMCLCSTKSGLWQGEIGYLAETSKISLKKVNKVIKHLETKEFVTSQKLLCTDSGHNGPDPYTTNDTNERTNERTIRTEVLPPDFFEIFTHWNKKGIVKHIATEKNKVKIKKGLKKRDNYSLSDIKKAIDNYDDVLKSDNFWTHKWDLWEFLARSGSDRFYPDEYDPNKYVGKNSMDEFNKTANTNPWEKDEQTQRNL